MNSKNIKNKMIILCGGRGKRMGNLTNKMPKPLIQVAYKPIIEHKLIYYKSQGLTDFVFCLGYKSNQLKKFLKKKSPNSLFHDAGVRAGILKRIDFLDLLQSHKRSKCALTIVAAPIQNPFGIVNWNSEGKALFFDEKPILNHYIGYSVISPNFFDMLNKRIINLKDGKGIIQAIKHLIKRKQVNIYKFKNLQITINSPEELKYARLNYKKYFTI